MRDFLFFVAIIFDMTAKIQKSAELDRALEKDDSVFLVDAAGRATHVVFPVEEARQMFDDYLHREVQRGIDQAARGESKEWNLAATLEEARRRCSDRMK